MKTSKWDQLKLKKSALHWHVADFTRMHIRFRTAVLKNRSEQNTQTRHLLF